MQYYFSNISIILYFRIYILKSEFPRFNFKSFLGIRNTAYKINYVVKFIVNVIFLFKFSKLYS